ncbi:MAG: LCP family protein [Clostridia bacterium]|nr:LCP family protein [Clostridia bacterium]
MKRDIEPRTRRRVRTDDRDIYSSSDIAATHKANVSHKKPKRHNTGVVVCLNILLSLLLSVCLVVAIGLPILMNSRLFTDSSVTREKEFDKVITSEASDSVQYILIAGTDEGKNLTDIMMVACFDMKRGTANILQIPRDTYIGADIPSSKMNAVYGHPKDGQTKINGLLRRVNEFFGLPIDHYITVTLSAFRSIVDAVGGVDVYVPENIYRAYGEADHAYNFYKGMNHMDGNMAEAFVRFRRDYAMGDYKRIQMQRSFYSAFIKKCLTMSSSQLLNVATEIYDEMTTDMTVSEVLDLASMAQSVGSEKIRFFAVPGQPLYYNGVSYFSIHKDDYLTMLNQHFLPYTVPIKEENLLAIELYSIVGIYKEETYIEDKESIESYLE